MTIYLDHAATTPVDPRVAAAMCEWLGSAAGQANPASTTHGMGMLAQRRVEEARAEVAALIGASPREIVFTSGATESNNLALLGVAAAARRAGRSGHFVSSRVEHGSVLDPLRQLEREGFAVTLLEPDESGRVPPEAVSTALRPDTLLVSLMLANNEVGVINDLAAVGEITAARGVLLHTDASQAVGKLAVDVTSLRVDLLSLTAHKFYGPKGIGALHVREAVRPRIAAILFGGGHERGLRSGTLASHQIVGLGVACSLARENLARDAAHVRDLAARLWRELETIPGVVFNSPRVGGVPGLVNASFPGVEGESLVTGLTDIAVSTGAACSSASGEPSYVLRALGRDPELAQSSLRLSLGRFSTAADVDVAAASIRAQVNRLRRLAGESVAAESGELGGMSPIPPGSRLALALHPRAAHYFHQAPVRAAQYAGGPAPPGVRQGCAGQASAGTRVYLELVLDEAGQAGGIVKSARFSAYGCPHTLAVVSWMCEALEGRRLDAGIPGTPADWAREFEVPIEKLGRLLIVEDAVRSALLAPGSPAPGSS
jgi:cysteine desulfurase